MKTLRTMSVWTLILSLFLSPAFALADRGRGGGDGDSGNSGQGQSVQMAQNSGNSGSGSQNSGPGSVNSNRDRDRDDDDDDRDNRRGGSGNSISQVIHSSSSGRGMDDERVRVRADGRVEIRGAVITSVNSSNSSLQITVAGSSFTVNAGSARLEDRDDNLIAFSAFAVGNEVRVKGMFSPTTSTSVIAATKVVNRSIEIEDECLEEDADDECIVADPDVTAPVISAIASAPSSTSAAITWTTNEPATSQVFFSTVSPLNISASTTQSVSSAALVTSHSIVITGLTASTTYQFAVRSADAAGNVVTSGQFSFTTQMAVADTTAPVLSGISTTVVAPNTVNVFWTTNEPATSKLFFGTTSPLVLTASTTMSVASSALINSHSISVSGLTASTTFQFVIQSADAAGNTATSSGISVVIP